MAERGSRFGRDERGSVSIQMVWLMPMLFGIVFVGLQAGLFYYGRAAAMSAATTGAQAAASESGTTATCNAAAATLISDLGDVLTHPEISCTRTATQVSVRVRGTTLSVIPGWNPVVEQAASARVERITR